MLVLRRRDHRRGGSQAGWRATQIAEDTIIDLPDLEFKGKPWQHVRSAMNRAKREAHHASGSTTLADEPFAVLAQVRAISEQWVGDKGLPEMGFTLGGVDEALDPEVQVALALDEAGTSTASPRGCRCTGRRSSGQPSRGAGRWT